MTPGERIAQVIKRDFEHVTIGDYDRELIASQIDSAIAAAVKRAAPDLAPAPESGALNPWRVAAPDCAPNSVYVVDARTREEVATIEGDARDEKLDRAGLIVRCVNGYPCLAAENARLRSVVEEQAARVVELERELEIASAEHDVADGIIRYIRTQNDALVKALEASLGTLEYASKSRWPVVTDGVCREARAALAIAPKVGE